MYEMNKLLHGQGACTGFSHSFFFVSEIERLSSYGIRQLEWQDFIVPS